MASWAGGYGAGGAADALKDLLAQKFLERKQGEVERAQRAQEAQAQAEMAQRADLARQNQQLQLTELGARRDENYQDRTQRVSEFNSRLQRQTTEDQIRAKERTDDTTTHTLERGEDREARAKELQSRQAFERAMMEAQRAPKEAGQVHFDKDAEGNPRAYRIGADNVAIPIALPGAEQVGPSKQDSFKADLDKFSTSVYNHPGLSSAGAGWNIGRSYNADFGNLKAASNQLVNMYLNDPDVKAKIAAMKPATDADVKRALSQAVNIDVENMDGATIKSEIDRLRTKAGLKALGTAPIDNGTNAGAGGAAPMTKEQKNTRTGQTRLVTSTDGGQSWH